MVCYRKNSRRNRSASRKNRKNSRSANRKNTRRNNTRRNNMSMYGGAYDASRLSLLQGQQFGAIHANQHGGQRGGGSWSGAGAGAPLGYDSRLPQELVASARVGPTLSALGEIAGMRDDGPGGMPVGGAAPGAPGAPQQTGGGRRRKGRKGSRKSKGRKSRKMRGGAYADSPASLSAPTMLLNPAQAARAGTADFSNPLLKH